MFNLVRTSFLLFVLALTASAASEENISQQIDVTPGGKLVVDIDFGTIDVTPGVDNKVALEAHRKIDFGDEAREKEYFSATPVNITRDGNVITVRARGSKQENWWNFGHSETHGQYTIHVPNKFETDLRTDGGDVAVGEITGNTTVKTSGGKLAFKHFEGVLAANTSGGSIQVEELSRPDQDRNERRRHYGSGWNGRFGRKNLKGGVSRFAIFPAIPKSEPVVEISFYRGSREKSSARRPADRSTLQFLVTSWAM